VNGNVLAPPSLDMSIDAVVAGGNLAAGKPFPAFVGNATVPESALRAAQCCRRFLVPVEVLGLTSPEFVWPFQAVPENVVLQMEACFSRRHFCVGDLVIGTLGLLNGQSSLLAAQSGLVKQQIRKRAMRACDLSTSMKDVVRPVFEMARLRLQEAEI